METLSPQQKTTPTRWYIQIGKIVLLLLLGFVGIVVLFFTAYFGYYLWLGKYGDATTQQELAKSFQENFTISPELRGAASASVVTQPIASLIHDHNPRFGNPDATVTIVAFIDFECPFCQRAYPTFERIKETYSPATQIIFKHFPIESIHPHARKASLAAQCAHEQGKFWEYYNLVFTEKKLDEESLFSYALKLRLNTRQFNTCVDTEKYAAAIDQDFQDGLTVGVRGTPTYIINQQKLEGSVPLSAWDDAIVQSLQQ
ncbi:MAG: hypothetical protein COU33_04830 [Candidatus Magasanikbacteria bacterium CG10_big_fil_rev_8_21_14_0_10_43_6]|uniref:Thioredoxin domain-containing protein n=1 Tax=Candidatus Magasanikbacteria bacterium CG10_big_fil_rev_8_21_14_0_10_43_6 TaxID=1974650 RepID=A0A2M6W016_9BACT|nr:MAG: hypothetical protein COU33_04830 [Candidatus Magasanikbacteria bacterium CG10_big_fil_rev_8_21_14_0_10_43_6]